MARSLAKSTIKKFQQELEAERVRLTEVIAEHEREMEAARNSETAADRSSDPENADAGSMRLEYAKELSIERNAADLLHKVEHALRRIESGGYGICEVCGEPIPVARLEVLPYATMCVTCASKS
ncbi:MAG TPA: TraR/DksA C4-type zinc finger protein [Acidimicrobiia bacterium]|nr:TraR/DksA C4-type zinc finger protein [Acidimicrobiia bacterium]